MNEKEINAQLKNDANLREAIARHEKRRRQMPPDLNGRLMQRLEDRQKRARTYRPWPAVAACIIVIICVGVFMHLSDRKTLPAEDIVAQNSVASEKPEHTATGHETNTASATEPQQETINEKTSPLPKPAQRKETAQQRHQNGTTAGQTAAANSSSNIKTDSEEPPAPAALPQTDEGQPIYTSAETAEDCTYQEASLVDDFIAKFAACHGVKPTRLGEPADSSVVSMVYVFPDKKEIDVFGRMMSVACWYDNATPGYQLSISNRQLLFKLSDGRKGREHLWLAERIRGSILLYCNCSPADSTVSAAGYREFRDKFAMPAIKSDNYHKF